MTELSKPLLQLQHITQIYQERVVLDDISLNINDSNQCIALFAPSGTGKSTLLHIAGLMSKPTTGIISYFGKKVSSESQKIKLRLFSIGFVFQWHHLMSELTALENVMIPLRLQGKSVQESKEKASQILHQLGMQDKLNQFPATLSGGENQRVAIARSVITGSKIIFADEPTGNLDSNSSEEVFTLLKTTLKNHHASALIITHDKTLARQCDNVLTLKDGKLFSMQI